MVQNKTVITSPYVPQFISSILFFGCEFFNYILEYPGQNSEHICFLRFLGGYISENLWFIPLRCSYDFENICFCFGLYFFYGTDH